VRKVLVIDDEPGICAEFAELLVDEGYDVTTAFSGKDALRELAGVNAPFDIIITDLKMPGMDGHELLSLAQAKGLLASAKIMVMSGHSSDPAGETLSDIEYDSFLRKPIDINHFLQQLEKP